MEEQEAISRAYELAYHLTPDLDEAAVQLRAQDIASLLTKLGGSSIITNREPKKIHLSYPITHKYYAHFGVIDFEAPTEAITAVNAQLKLEEGVLRFLLVAKPVKNKEIRALGDQRNRRSRVQVAPTHKTAPEVKKEKTEEKEIEKELEGVLGKI
ncbi:MAG: 30S ribosomal protein S6 [Patescibacteria group bacterium]